MMGLRGTIIAGSEAKLEKVGSSQRFPSPSKLGTSFGVVIAPEAWWIECQSSISLRSKHWKVGSELLIQRTEDRARPGMDLGPSLITTSLAPQDAKRVNELIKERSRLESQIRTLEREQFVFAGKFRVPDPIHWLNRGDPEQPQELVKAAVPLFLGSIQLPDTSSDKDRRIALADWIANASNVLTTRVIVNRVWQGHFGNGLVNTPAIWAAVVRNRRIQNYWIC